jgi:hypothetical protein
MKSLTSTLIAASILVSLAVLAQETPASGSGASVPAGTPSTATPQPSTPSGTPGDPGAETPTDLPTDPQPVAPGPGPVTPTTGASFGEPLAGTSQIGGASMFGAMPFDSEALFRWGRLNLRPRLSYTFSYGNGLSYRLGEEASSVIHQFSPGLTINLGDQWALDYAPTLRWYSDEAFEDVINHRVSLTGRTSFRDWLLRVSQGFSRTTDPLIETGSETDQDTYSTSLSAGRSLNSKLSVDLGLSQSLRFMGNESGSSGLTDRKSWSTMNWLDYQYIERLSFGLGAGFTYDSVERGSDMTSEQVQGRIRWVPGTKLSLALSAGLDIRQYLDSDASGTVAPIFSFTAGYRLFEATSLFAGASRSVSPSYYSQTLSESTGLTAGLNQRFLGRYFLSLNGGYTIRDYSGTGDSRSGRSGEHESYSFGANLGTGFLKRGSISVFYNKTWNDGSSGFYSFDPQTVGAQISYRF